MFIESKAPVALNPDLSGRGDMSYGSESQIALPHESDLCTPLIYSE